MLKKKNIYVIAVSVFISFLVILSAFLGLIIYLQWRQLSLASQYYEETAKLDTLSYSKNMALNDLTVSRSSNGTLFMGGKIKNAGRRNVSSVAITVNFMDLSNSAVYSYTIYPLTPLGPTGFLKNIHFMHLSLLKRAYLKDGETLAFKCALRGVPKTFMKMLQANSFSAKPGEWCGRIEGKLTRLRLEPA